MPDDFLTKPLVLPDSPAEWYHEHSKCFLPKAPEIATGEDRITLANRLAESLETQAKEKFVAEHSKKYPTAERLNLSLPHLPEGVSPANVLLGGGQADLKDAANVTASPLPLAVLSAVLGFGYGQTQQAESDTIARRYLVSPGNLFPLEVYLLALRVEGLDEGTLLHYQTQEHALEHLGHCAWHKILPKIWQTPQYQTAVFIFFIGCWRRLRWRYGERSYRYLLLEAGQAAQNMAQVAAAWQRSWAAEYTFCDDAIHDLFLLDGVAECALHTLALA